jgi:hypothetical protein
MTRSIFDRARRRGHHRPDRPDQLLRRYGVSNESPGRRSLASDDVAYITGQAIAVDGGLTSSIPVYGRTSR